MESKVKNWAGKSNLLDQDNKSKFYAIEKQTGFQALMLDIKFANGNFQALPYSFITKITFNPSIAIEIFTTEEKCKIEGRNLIQIYNQLLKHRVTFIKETESEFDDTEESECYIEKISIEPLSIEI